VHTCAGQTHRIAHCAIVLDSAKNAPAHSVLQQMERPPQEILDQFKRNKRFLFWMLFVAIELCRLRNRCGIPASRDEQCYLLLEDILIKFVEE
jgi:hypothetical protein